MNAPVTPEQTVMLRRAAALVDYHCQVLTVFEVELIDSIVDRWREAGDDLIVTDAEWPALEAALQGLEADRARADRMDARPGRLPVLPVLPAMAVAVWAPIVGAFVALCVAR